MQKGRCCGAARVAPADAADPRCCRSTFSGRSAPHDAAWLTARFSGEAGPFAPLPDQHRARILHALGTGAVTVPIPDRPCPWCAGQLILRGSPFGDAVTCTTGADCTAPVRLDEEGHRTWADGEDIAALHTALAAADRRRRRRDAKREGVRILAHTRFS